MAVRRAVAVVGSTFLELTYQRPANVTDVSYEVQWSDNIDAGAWSSTGVTQQIMSDNGVTRTIRALIPKGATSHRFVRLKVRL